MADFDPSIISAIPDMAPHPAQAIERGITLRDMVDREQLSRLQTQTAQREAKESSAVQDILKGSDYSTAEGLAATAAKVNKVSPSKAMELMKWGQQYQSGQVQQQLDQLTLAGQRQDLIVSAVDPIVAQARQMKNQGASDLAVKAFITQQMPQAIQQLRGMKLPDGKPALPDDQLQMVTQVPGGYSLPTLESWEAKSKQGAAAIKQRLEQFKADTQEKRADETLRENRARDTREDAKQDLAERKETARRAEAEEGLISDESAQLAVDRMLNGEQARDVLANFGRGKQGATNITKVQNLLAKTAKERGIDSAELTARLVEMKGLQKEQQTEASIAGKISYAEKEIEQIGPKVLEASAKVPRGAFVPWNRLRQYTAKQLSDPNLKQLKAYLTTLTNSYDVLGGRGGTDVEKRAHNRELLDAADSPEALKAAVDAITQEAALSHTAANESMTVDRDRMRREATPAASPGAGAGGPQSPPATVRPPASAGPAAPAQPAANPRRLEPGQTYKHASGATVEILPD